MLDYLGCYTKILKYDAVPTLYLPTLSAKHDELPAANDVAEIPITNETSVVDRGEMKNFIVYNTLPTEAQKTDSAFNPTMEPNPDDMDKITEHKNKLKEKYGYIRNKEQLQLLKSANEDLRANITNLNQEINKIKQLIREKHCDYKTKDVDLVKLQQQCGKLSQSTMSLQEEKNILSRVFSESQIKILSGKKKIYWSNDDMAMGYTIRHLSNKRCYMYLTKNLNIPLPALSSIKRWATIKKNEFVKADIKKGGEC